MTTHQKAALSGDHRSEFIFLVLSICARCSGNHSNKVILGNSNVKTPKTFYLTKTKIKTIVWGENELKWFCDLGNI